MYPGVTEDICIPVLEKASGLKWKTDFNVGYSPERINPGDKDRRFDNILKIVSADTPETLDIVDATYRDVVTAGTHRAGSIKVAEFAKVLENTQRDINIALINEVALISDRLGLDTRDVLDAAGAPADEDEPVPVEQHHADAGPVGQVLVARHSVRTPDNRTSQALLLPKLTNRRSRPDGSSSNPLLGT